MLKRNSSKVQSEAAGVKGSSNQPTIHNESCLIHYRRKSKKGGQKKEKQRKKNRLHHGNQETREFEIKIIARKI